MTYYIDLSKYEYHNSMFYKPGTVNVGWLDPAKRFAKASPASDIVELLWEFCKVSVAQMRGIQECPFCNEPGDFSNSDANYSKRGDERLLLGTSEIRVFSLGIDIYAAPTLIYHYVKTHNYKPPDSFIGALRDGPNPRDDAYFSRLEQLGLEWRATSAPERVEGRSGAWKTGVYVES